MSEKITLQHAFGVWEKGRKEPPGKTDIHPSVQLIQRLANGLEPDGDRWFGHLADCGDCRARWMDEMERDAEINTFTDMVFAKVAGGGRRFEKVTRLSSESGRYQITLRRKVGDRDSILVTLTVLKGAGELEGRNVVVRDKNRKKLLEGAITQGELSGWRKGPDDIDVSFISVIPGE